MIAALIFVMSMAALAQFAISQWRSIWVTIAAQPLSDSLQDATGIENDAIGPEHFELLVRAANQLGKSAREGSLWLKEVRVYYRGLVACRKLSAHALPTVAKWANRELGQCAKFAAAILDRRMNNSLAYNATAQNS